MGLGSQPEYAHSYTEFLYCVCFRFVCVCCQTDTGLFKGARVLCYELLFGYRIDFLHGDDSIDQYHMPK